LNNFYAAHAIHMRDMQVKKKIKKARVEFDISSVKKNEKENTYKSQLTTIHLRLSQSCDTTRITKKKKENNKHNENQSRAIVNNNKISMPNCLIIIIIIIAMVIIMIKEERRIQISISNAISCSIFVHKYLFAS